MYATRALLPPMLQDLMNYPVATTGLVTAPSGAGTMVAMLFAGRLAEAIDCAAPAALGLPDLGFALWQMMHYTIVLSAVGHRLAGRDSGLRARARVRAAQRARPSPRSRPSCAPTAPRTYSLMRNIGSSIGISIVQTLMTRNTQVAHADLAANVTPFNPAMQPILSTGSIYDMAVLNQSITQQASMIAYLNDFKLMFVATLLVIPLLLLIRPARKAADESVAHAAMD